MNGLEERLHEYTSVALTAGLVQDGDEPEAALSLRRIAYLE